ncbi:MAG: ABC transporter permease [Sterolibacterium sp.]|nr:ABC transporter permease [Sterolibacterium sp.]
MAALLRQLWTYRGFIAANVRRDIAGRYAGTLLGGAWTLLQPLAMILIYTLVFSQLMHARLAGSDSPYAYSIYLCAGTLPWVLFAESIGRMTSVFLEYGNLIKKAQFPKVCLPAIALLAASFNFVAAFAIFLVFLTMIGAFPGWLLLPFAAVLAVQLALAAGLGVMLGTLNVFFRDIGQATTVGLQFWFWLTPIVYPLAVVPQWLQDGLRFNPMVPIVTAYQRMLVNGAPPELAPLVYPAVLALLLAALGYRLFRLHGGEMADEL